MCALKVDVMLAVSPDGAAERAQQLQALGVDGAFTFEGPHDVFFPLTLAAPVCDLALFTNIAVAFPRSPMHLAHAAYDLQLLTRGRFRLGLGSQIKAHVEKRYGGQWDKPVAQMRDWVLAVKAILNSWQDGTRLDYRGSYTTHTLMTPPFNPGPNPYGVPKILVGALGPKMMQLAAEVADGVLVMPFNSGRHMAERSWPAIHAGMSASGRRRDDIEVTAEVIVAVGRNDAELHASRAVRSLLAFYASTPAYRPVLDVHGWQGLQPELNALSKQGDWAAMSQLITDEMLRTIAVHGTPKEVAAEIANRYADCDRLCAYFPGYDVRDDLLGEFVHAVKEATA